MEIINLLRLMVDKRASDLFVTVDVHKNVPFYSPDSFFSFVPPHQKRFLWEDPLRIFSSFVRFGDGRVFTQYKVFPNTTIALIIISVISI